MIRATDYFLTQFCAQARPLLRWMGDWETRFLGRDLASIAIDRPVFITGLARSGTTLLLELLALVDGVATHRYRDFPFLMTPYLWNRYLDLFAGVQTPVERPHRDRVRITRESPEAMEEPLWQAFFPHVHADHASHRLSAETVNPAFECFYRDHIRKMLLIRRGSRYVAKGNYHIPRLEYLLHLFPDALFIIPVRRPLTHVHSLVRQHLQFCDYAASDPRVPRYLAAAGHFEFGPQRRPIRLSAAASDRIVQAWSCGEDYLAYSIQWAEIYGFVNALRTNPDLAAHMLIVRYEDLCAEPDATLRRILDFAGFGLQAASRATVRLDTVSQSTHSPVLEPKLLAAINAEVRTIAMEYGYELG